MLKIKPIKLKMLKLKPAPKVHDGRRSTAQLIGSYCGSTLPGNNGTIISTHNSIYLWFRSDESYAATGFNFTWNTTDPGRYIHVGFNFNFTGRYIHMGFNFTGRYIHMGFNFMWDTTDPGRYIHTRFNFTWDTTDPGSYYYHVHT